MRPRNKIAIEMNLFHILIGVQIVLIADAAWYIILQLV